MLKPARMAALTYAFFNKILPVPLSLTYGYDFYKNSQFKFISIVALSTPTLNDPSLNILTKSLRTTAFLICISVSDNSMVVTTKSKRKC